MKKRLCSLTAIIFLSLLFLYFVPFPKRVDLQYSGIKWLQGDPAFQEKVEIRITGTYYRYLLKNDAYKGSIILSDVDFTDGILPVNVTMLKYDMVRGVGFCSPIYYNSQANVMDSTGSFYIRGIFGEIVIVRNGGEFVSFPAVNRDEAVSVAAGILGELWKLK